MTEAPKIVLVVDDEREVISLLCEIINRLGYAVAVPPAPFVAAAIACMPCDVLMTDLVMPDVTGYEIIAEMREHRPDVPIIAFSGKGTYVSERVGKHLIGADVFLAKPLTIEMLRGALSTVLTPHAA